MIHQFMSFHINFTLRATIKFQFPDFLRDFLPSLIIFCRFFLRARRNNSLGWKLFSPSYCCSFLRIRIKWNVIKASFSCSCSHKSKLENHGVKSYVCEFYLKKNTQKRIIFYICNLFAASTFGAVF
jgi:hypothetical protein